jgi:hypothetical protein
MDLDELEGYIFAKFTVGLLEALTNRGYTIEIIPIRNKNKSLFTALHKELGTLKHGHFGSDHCANVGLKIFHKSVQIQTRSLHQVLFEGDLRGWKKEFKEVAHKIGLKNVIDEGLGLNILTVPAGLLVVDIN